MAQPSSTLEAAQELVTKGEEYYVGGNYPAATQMFERALAIREALLGPNHLDVATSLGNVAFIYDVQGRFAEAEPLYRRALAVQERALGREHQLVATSLNGLAAVEEHEGKFDEAEALYERALAVRQKVLGDQNPETAMSLNNLGLLYKRQARYGEAEPLLTRALAIYEEALGQQDPNVGVTLNNLGSIFDDEGRYDEAEPLLRRALVIFEKARPGQPDLAACLNNLGNVYRQQGRYAEAETYMRRGIEILEKVLGPDHPNLADALNNLVEVYQAQRRYGEAEPLMKRALAALEKSLGSAHPDVATALNNLAYLYDAEGKHSQADPLLLRSLLIRKGLLGPEHPSVALAYYNLAEHYRLRGSDDLALDMARHAVEILSMRAERTQSPQRAGVTKERRSRRPLFLEVVRLLARRVEAGQSSASEVDEAFEAAQYAAGVETARAISAMAARFEAGGGALGRLVRQQQDLQKEWQALDAALIGAAGQTSDQRDPLAEEQGRQELARVDHELSVVEARLRTEFPRYAELASVQPISVSDVQRMLAPDEALVTWAVADDECYLFAISPAHALLTRIETTADDLRIAVTLLRQGLEPPESLRSVQDLPPFDTHRAYELYHVLLGPAEEMLAHSRRLIVVLDGALQSLPLGVLVTEPQSGEAPRLSDYRSVPWLVRRYALTSLPAVSSLRALRIFAARAHGSEPFVGFGDPDFDGTGSMRGIRLTEIFRGANVDVDAIRKLPRLPETAGELRALAKILHAPDRSIHLGVHASVPEVERTDLSDTRVIAFSTHGLVAGDLPGLAEPALALTPPAIPGPTDDGLLTASRVATLKLNADWVILSACNTAAPDGSPGAEGLSGLAKAFFYAGARSLLVSHWPVFSTTTIELITETFRALDRAPSIGRAEALRRATLAMIGKAGAQSDAAYYAHPMIWAPFVVVGD